MSAAGTWTLTLETPIGERKATLTLAEDGGLLSGRMTADEGNATDIKDGKLAGNRASWKADIKNPMPLTLEFQATVEGDSISGSVNTTMGSWPFSGSRSSA
jgi:hypothetical protein